MKNNSQSKTWTIIALLTIVGLSLGVVNPALARGIDMEPLAKDESEMRILSVLDDIREAG